MTDALRLADGWVLVWVFGILVVAAIQRRSTRQRSGESWAWTIGCGFFAGAFMVTVWMRALSLAGIPFSFARIALPMVIASIALAVLVRRRAPADDAARTPAAPDFATLSRGGRALLYVLVAWLALRFVTLLLDVVWTPLYPWDAWIQWATKARVWYSLGQIVPFGRTDAWFAANGALWFDASPNYPATVPLWQVWSSVALGRWDDALMNLPWWLVAVALAIAIYGALRESGLSPLGATIGAWLASSLPLANVHVALAGYADLPMAAYYALAALAAWRWSRERTVASALLALLFAAACTTIKTPGVVWALTLLPGVVLALMPRRGPRIVAIGLAVALLTLAVLAQTDPVVLGYRLHLDFAPAWLSLVDSLFLLGNWHLLWYAVIAAAIVGWRVLRSPAFAPLSATVASGLLFLVVAFSFTNARNWVTDQTTINRAVLHIAPLALIWTIVVVHAWLHGRIRTGSRGSVDPAAAASAA
jgi:hypothetical protein